MGCVALGRVHSVERDRPQIDRRDRILSDEEQQTEQTEALASLRRQIGHLAEADEATVTAGHLDLGADIWLSTDPAGQGAMTCLPVEAGFILRLEAGDSGAWAALGMRFGPEQLAGARYLGLLVAQRAGDVVSFTPTLRFFRPEGLRDVPSATPVLLAGGPRETLAHIRIDPGDIAGATGCELNLFFHSDAFVAEFTRLEPLLIL